MTRLGNNAVGHVHFTAYMTFSNKYKYFAPAFFKIKRWNTQHRFSRTSANARKVNFCGLYSATKSKFRRASRAILVMEWFTSNWKRPFMRGWWTTAQHWISRLSHAAGPILYRAAGPYMRSYSNFAKQPFDLKRNRSIFPRAWAWCTRLNEHWTSALLICLRCDRVQNAEKVSQKWANKPSKMLKNAQQ